jgi:hypothetical protein
MDTFKINIDAESKEFCLKIPYGEVLNLIAEEQTINIPPETLKQTYFFYSKEEDKENFSLNVGLQARYEEEEYDKEFWEDYHNKHDFEEEVTFTQDAGFITEDGEKNSYKETLGQEYYYPEAQGSWGNQNIEL